MDDKIILITGGSGSLGTALIKYLYENYEPKKVIVYSRDEFKHSEMRKIFKQENLRFFIGDVRDHKRLNYAFNQVNIVIHAAALKQVPALEYNPFEAVKTNVLGTQNVVQAALRNHVEKVLYISTDKAVEPINVYGTTKALAEKIIISANNHKGESDTIFSAVRYGNVMSSKGSVIPYFQELARKSLIFPITNEQMTRFNLTMQKAIDIIEYGLKEMKGGDIFVPKVPSYRILDLAMAIDENCKVKETGIRPGEKLHEVLVSKNEANRTIEDGNYYRILSDFALKNYLSRWYFPKVDEYFEYNSRDNDKWLTVKKLRELIKKGSSC